MCGILFSSKEGIDKDQFSNALALMKHRGPDAPCCLYQHKQFLLGHNRLSIVDLNERSNQPFFSDDGRYAIIFNGEIYNYRELASKYSINMKTNSDTELLLKLYIEYGSSMLNWLNGMFSFIILDTDSNDFFVARDRLGVKPLYYYNINNCYLFSSEIAPLFVLAGKQPMDDLAIRQYKKMRSFFNNRTIFKNIYEFPPGSYMENMRIHKYWSIDYSEKEPPTDEELYYLLRSAVEYRKIADVEIGSYLSGGLDSTIVTGLAGVEHSWTIGFDSMNEFEWSSLAAEKFRTKHHPIIMLPDEFIALSKELIHKKKEPLSVPNEVLLYHMTKQAKGINTVIMSGEGADELFYGYDRIFRWASQEKEWDLKGFSKQYTYGSHEDDEIVAEAIEPFLYLKSPIKIISAFFQEAHLKGLLKRLDSATMLNSVEARSPFVDYRLVERLSGVGIDYKMENGVIKAPLKRVFKDLIPREIIERRKVGFPVPLNEILPGSIEGETFFDKWFNYNLKTLGEIL